MSFQRSLLILIALLPLACGAEQEEREFRDPFSRLERLVFLPAGSCLLFPLTTRPVDCSTPRALLVDAFEVTRQEWLAAASAGSEQGRPLPQEAFWGEGGPYLPATGMSLEEAQEFAKGEGMRLPTAREWIRLAAGTRAQQYPWTTVSRESVDNTSKLGFGQLAAVGVFHGGRTPSGIYDLSGNAAEWVTDWAGLVRSEEVERWEWAMGGSYLQRQRPTYAFDSNALGSVAYNAVRLNPGHRGLDVGMRLVVDAEAWILRSAAAWPTGGRDTERLRIVGKKWGVRAQPLLRSLIQEHPNLPALKGLLDGTEQ